MKTTPFLHLVSLAMLACAAQAQAATDSPLTRASTAWSASVDLEKNSDYPGALAKMAEFAQAGGEAYLVELRSGWLCYSAKDYAPAVRHYEMASQIAPTALSPLLALLNTYRAQGNNTKAEKAAAQVLARDPVNYSALQALAALAFEQRDYRRASQCYDAILKSYPEDVAALSGQGWTMIYLNRKREAAAAFSRLLVLSSSYPDAQQGYDTAVKNTIASARP